MPTQPQSYLINFLLLVTLHFRPVICSPPVTNSSISDVVNEARDVRKNPDCAVSLVITKHQLLFNVLIMFRHSSGEGYNLD